MTEHASPATLEAFVMGATAPDEETRLQSHLATCETCAAALTSEARLEEALYATAARVQENPIPISASARPATRRRRGLWATVAATPVAAAAAWLIVAAGGARVTPDQPDPTTVAAGLDSASMGGTGGTALVTCASGTGQRRCLRSAQRQGLAVLSGDRVVVPRYETSVQLAFDTTRAGLLIP